MLFSRVIPATDLPMTDRAEDSGSRPSKSARKREAQEIRKLADQLVAMKAARLKKLPLADDVRREVEAAREMASHGALRRQKQYIARLLRDACVSELRDAIAGFDSHDQADTRWFRQAEQWRESLLRDRTLPPVADTIVDDTTRELCMKLVTRYHASRGEGERKRHARQLFRMLHDAIRQQGEDRHD